MSNLGDVTIGSKAGARTRGAWFLRIAFATFAFIGVGCGLLEILARRALPEAASTAARPAQVERKSSKATLSLKEELRRGDEGSSQPARQNVHGYVLTRGGAPLEHATVCSVAGQDSCCDYDACVDTDSAGRFQFPELLGPEALLVASASGYVTVEQHIEWGPAGAAVAQEVRLEPDASRMSLTGAVHDVYGGPIAGAVVSMTSDLMDERGGVTLSKADGSFALTVRRSAAHVCARADAYARVCNETLAPSEGNTIVLMPASAIVGRVVATVTGEAVAGAMVRAVNLDGLRVPVSPARSQADGSFMFGALPPGEYLLTAVSEHTRSAEAAVTVGVAETTRPIILTASPSIRFSATVLLGDQPCPGAEVTLSGPVHASEGVSTEGRVSIDGLAPGSYRAVALCRGRRDSMSLDVVDRPVHHVWTFEAPSEPLEFENRGSRPGHEPGLTAQGGTIKVRVSNPAAAEGPILIFANAGSPTPLRARQRGGEFIFDALPNGEYRVHPFDDVEQARSASIRGAGELVEVQVTLLERGTISGIVVDEGGAPVSDAWVSHSRDGVPEGDAMVGSPALADENGAFALRVTRGVAYSIVVNSPAGEGRVQGARSGEHIQIQVGSPRASTAKTTAASPPSPASF